CTDDTCNPGTGCVHTANAAPCNEGNACTTNDTCSGGKCVAGRLRTATTATCAPTTPAIPRPDASTPTTRRPAPTGTPAPWGMTAAAADAPPGPRVASLRDSSARSGRAQSVDEPPAASGTRA